MSEWISVKDRMPDEPGRYLVVLNRIAPEDLGGNNTRIMILKFMQEREFRYPVHFPTWINDEIKEAVTHWVPLPEPPKEDV